MFLNFFPSTLLVYFPSNMRLLCIYVIFGFLRKNLKNENGQSHADLYVQNT